MTNENNEKLAGELGEEFGTGLREASGYKKTQEKLRRDGITEEILNHTPTVGLNLKLIEGRQSVTELGIEFEGRSLQVAMFGLAIPDGANDFQNFITTQLRGRIDCFHVVEIDRAMIDAIEELRLPNTRTHHVDARHTDLPSNSQNILIRDHLGNCCPPTIDSQIDEEVLRVLKPHGIAIVNITTSEILSRSLGRRVITFDELSKTVSTNIIEALKTRIYDLTQLKKEFGKELEMLRSHIVEIEPNGSFVVFGEDENGHGEWYRSFEDHLQLWKSHGFEVIDMGQREGDDDHKPPLRCNRHSVILRKKEQV